MGDELQKYAVIELKYDEGKVFTVRRKWIINPKQKYTKTDDVFCYWSSDLEDSPEEMNCEYSKKFTGEPALFKVFVVNLADSLDEAKKYMEGRLKSVPNKFREPGNTDEEIQKMQLKQRRSDKKELKSQKAQAHAFNMDYLIDEIKLQSPSASSLSVSRTPNKIVITENNSVDEEIVPSKRKKIKNNLSSKKIKYTKENESQKDEKDMSYDPHLPDRFESHACEMLQENTTDENTNSATDLISMGNFQPPPSTSVITVHRLECVSDPEKSIIEEKQNSTETLSSSLEFSPLSNDLSPLCEIPSTFFGIEFEELNNSIMTDTYNEYLHYNQMEGNNSQQSEDALHSQFVLSETTSSAEPSGSATGTVTNDSLVNNPPEQVEPCISGANIVVLNFDELTMKYNAALEEGLKQKAENESLRTELSKANRRNILLQDYLVAVDERVPEILFVDKDGGRMYRDNVFITKKQCAVLDKAKTDNEYINNLLVCIFGREVLTTHTLSGKRGKNKKDSNGQPSASTPLDKCRLSLIYDIMDARAVANKTTKLTKTEINAVITKKISNLTTYAEKSLIEDN